MGTAMATNCTLAIIAILIIIIIAVLVWKRRKVVKRGAFTVSDPAVPKVRDAMGRVLARITCLISVGEVLNAKACNIFEQIKSADPPQKIKEAALPAFQAERAMTPLIDALRATKYQMKRLPPTHANYLSFYEGFSEDDDLLRKSAATYRRKAEVIESWLGNRDVQVAASNVVIGTITGNLESIATSFKELSRLIDRLIRDVHVLGVALGTE